MILEVNNTFDERRMYFLNQDNDINTASSLEIDAPKRLGNQTRLRKFTSIWAKDFHVSPFNSRKGMYSLVAYDPLDSSTGNHGFVNNVITLNSPADNARLIAKIISIEPAITVDSIAFWSLMRILSSWWWIGFATFPRILKEAAVLTIKKMSIWYRPEVSVESLGRTPTATEK
jgi:hypothetical protein